MNTQKPAIELRQATLGDVSAVMTARGQDSEWGPADPRTGAYLEGQHHPQSALPPRVLFVALSGAEVVGYIAGHLTTRYECDGELQYLWVTQEFRRYGVASQLFALLAKWFHDQGATQVCVDVEPSNLAARSFYTDRGAVELNSHWLVWRDITAARL